MDPAKPSGYDALARGNIWQARIADAWGDLGWGVQVGWGHDEPDIVTFSPTAFLDDAPEKLVEPFGVVNQVVSVKTFHLVPSGERFDQTGKHSWAVARTIYRKDVLPEINFALSHGLNFVLLTIVNTRNEIVEHIEVDCGSFQRYTTSQQLNDDSRQKVYTIQNASQTEEDTQLGWRRLKPFEVNRKRIPLSFLWFSFDTSHLE